MSIGINVLKELQSVYKKIKHNKVFLLDIQNIADYCSELYLEVKDQTNSEEYAINWCDDSTLAILAISNHFFNDAWTNATFKTYNELLNTLFSNPEFIDWCIEDNNEDVISIHTNNNKDELDISNCFYVQVLNDYAFYLKKKAKAKQMTMLSRLDKDYATKALKSVLKLIKYTIDLYK